MTPLEAASSIVKLSFSKDANGFKGSYKCFCKNEGDEFWCQQSEVLENEKKGETDENVKSQAACYCEKTFIDLKSRREFECICVQKSLLVSCNNQKDIQNSQVDSESTLPSDSSLTFKSIEQKYLDELCDQSNCGENFERFEEKLYKSSGTRTSNITEDLCPCQCSTETAMTPRSSVDENVVTLLKSIFDVLQTIKDDKYPVASKNDEQFNGGPSSSSSTPSQSPLASSTLRDSASNQSTNNLDQIEVQFDGNFMEMNVFEPPERDLEDENYEKPSPATQRLIPVDMDLLRTDEELIWEPELNFDEPEIKEEPSSGRKHSMEDENQRDNASSTPRTSENLKELDFSNDRRLSSNFRKSVLEDEMTSRQKGPKSEVSQGIQVDLEPLQNLTSCSTQFYEETVNEQTELPTKISQEIQVNPVSLQNLTSRSIQLSTLGGDGIIDLKQETAEESSQISTPRSTQFWLFDEKFSQRTEPKTEVPQIIQSDNEAIQFSGFHENEADNASPSQSLTSHSDNKLQEVENTSLDSETNITTQETGTDCPNFENMSSQSSSSQQSREMTHFLESMRLDLEAMNSARRNNSPCWNKFAKLPCPPTGGWRKPSKDLSFPATIEAVQELGANSLFVKWSVQNIGNIGGYEVFLDGHLTNRYFNCIHRAAVICNVNLQCPHRITLRACPLLPSKTTASTALPMTNANSCSPTLNNNCPNTHPEASCPQPDGSVWYPSVYHFEPNSPLPAPQNAVLY